MKLVRNIPNTSDRTCGCNSWIEHWGKYNTKKYPVNRCAAINGPHDGPIVGAHVRTTNPYDTTAYIVPLCSRHNQVHSSETIEIYDDTSFAVENPAQTCK